jgi:hypothetical protein
MTVPGSKAWHELEWSMSGRNTLVFKDKVSVGQLVFKYDDSTYVWRPYWVVDENDGLYEIIAAYGGERIEGVSADKLGIAVNADGKTYNEIH